MAAFGVYFGSSSSCIAVCRDGRTDVIANDLGDRVTPAAVAFTDHDQAIGLAAKQGIFRNPMNTICDVKLLIGRSYDDDDLSEIIESSPVKILNSDGKPIYEVTFKEKNCSFTPVEIASTIYKKMMETATSSEGSADSHDAVLTVPLNFNEHQRESVKEAAVKAGFNILRIINEPSAALLAYDIGQNNQSESCVAMVFRLGHRSLDITLVDVKSGMYNVLASHTEQGIGGHMIDGFVVEHFAAEFQRQHRFDCRGNKRSMGKLQNACETCKHVLSTINVSHCSVESLYDGIDFSCSLSRSRLEALCSSLIQRCLQPLDGLLTKAKLKRNEIHKVVLCGGCTKIPLIQQQLKEFFREAEVLCSIPPDEVMAVGAAIQAGILCGKSLHDVDQFSTSCELSCLSADILIVTVTEESNDDSEEVVLFKSLTPIPVRKQLTFRLTPNATSFCLRLMQRRVVSDETMTLAQIVMKDLPQDSLISGIFHVRHDGSLHATCSETASKQMEDVIIESSHL